jgi:hypothetical protein
MAVSRFSAEHLSHLASGQREDGAMTAADLLLQLAGADKNKLFNKLKQSASPARKTTAKKGKSASKKDDDVVILDDTAEDTVSAILKDVDLQNKDIPGAEFVKPVHGFFCQLCKNFFAPGKEVVKTHCATKVHLANLKVSRVAAGKHGAEEAAGGPPSKRAK